LLIMGAPAAAEATAEEATAEGMDETRISALIESNLHGIGDVRLRKH